MTEGVGEQIALGKHLPVYSVVGFVGLLLGIALLPLIAPHFWERNSRKAIVSAIFSVPILVYFFWIGHPGEIGFELHEYFQFIVLLAALYVVSGGIVLSGDIRGTPAVNTMFLMIGSVLANLVGTTGASMILIRPVLRINTERTRVFHIPLFFIFLVSNMGGCLTPLGDPPLFMGYLKGVPFFWTLNLLPMWAMGVTLVLISFYVFDTIQYRREPKMAIEMDITRIEPVRLHGKYNFIFLFGIMGAVLLKERLPEHGPMTLLGEVIMIAMAVIAYIVTPDELRRRNSFTFHPIIEVAVLFAGIFITMVPALLILKARGGEFGVDKPWHFFWLTGSISSFLDNTPTYLTYLSLAQGLTLSDPSLIPEIVGVPAKYLQAISVGAVFMGANTYIGNAPNFMVKSICEETGYHMPSFFGYLFYAIIFLFPTFILVTLVFFI